MLITIAKLNLNQDKLLQVLFLQVKLDSLFRFQRAFGKPLNSWVALNTIFAAYTLMLITVHLHPHQQKKRISNKTNSNSKKNFIIAKILQFKKEYKGIRND